MTQKVVVNCRFLTQPVSGVQRFAIEICKELKKANLDIIFVAPKNIIHKSLAKQLDVVEIGYFKGHLWEQMELKLFVAKEKALLICLCNTAPLFLKNQIITIHDLCFLNYPQWFSFYFRKAYSFLIPRIAKKAMHILTVSETSKKEIIDIIGIDENKISVIYNAVTPIFKSFETKKQKNLSIEGKYILSVSSHHPRKNFERLVFAFLDLGITDLKLVIVGNFHKHFKNENIKFSDRVIFKENVDDRELMALYKNAELFVYPSLYEGFGIPIIEAMSLGTQVCISDIPVFREICGGYAVYFDPSSVNEIKESIKLALKKPKEDHTNFLKKFDWQKSAVIVENKLTELRNRNT
ncbi:glycosyltransferase family 4 protein [Aquimarina rubra]|uniref:Glycosyltransferase family 4 protein n=1 Tax=Aquimarina rubra TaxID=1920033 RepID=A0ABW5LHB9_9FLAO